jgi:hypothetical protein
MTFKQNVMKVGKKKTKEKGCKIAVAKGKV